MTQTEYNNCVESYADNVYRFILKSIKNQSDAEDIVQNSFEILWRKHEEVSYEKAKSYLFTVARNNMIDQIRKMKRIEYPERAPEETLATGNGFTGASDALNQALDQLPDIQRQVVLLRDYEGYAYDEIGEITGLNESQVKVYIFRARKTLQKLLVKIDNVI